MDARQHQHVTAQSSVDKAITYTLVRWDKLFPVYYQRKNPIDNNLVENSIRPLAIGRKLFVCRFTPMPLKEPLQSIQSWVLAK
nr:transposase [Bacteroidota bacterium]